MTPQIAPRRPWCPDDSRRAVRGRVLVRTRDERDHIPHRGDVAIGAALAAPRIDDRQIDRVLAGASPAVRVTRVYAAASNLGEVGARHRGFDADEIDLGLSRTFQVELAPDAPLLGVLHSLRSLEAVEMASPVYLADCPFGEPASPPEDPEWAHRMVRGGDALRDEPGDPAMIVAVVDSGVRAHHPELRGRVRGGMDLVDLPDADLSRGIQLLGDRATRDRDPDDEMGHGTGCASIIAGRGLAVPPGIAGVAPILPIRVLAAALIAERAAPTAIGTLPDIDAGVKLAVDLGARVLNLSFGTPETALREGDPIPHLDVVQYALRRGCVLVAASGNSGDDTRYFPACVPGVIAVGSIGQAGRPSRFSTRGAHVALSAPGEHIRCAGLSGGITASTGTSFAAPFVAGAAALVLAAAWRRGTPLGPFTVRDLLVHSARPFASGTDATGCGRGILDVGAAIAAAIRWSESAEDTRFDEVGPPPSAVLAGPRLPRPTARPTHRSGGTHVRV